MSIAFLPGDVRGNAVEGLVGQWYSSSHLNDYDTGINKDPQAKQIGTIVVATSTNSHEYIVTINGVDVSYTADGSTSKIEIAAGLAAAIEAEPLVRGSVTAASDGIDTVTVTGTYPGVAFTMTDAEAKLTTTEASTAAASAAAVPFGVALKRTGYDTTGERLVCLAASGKFTAQVDTIDIDYDASSVVFWSIDVDGQSYAAGSTSATNEATIIAALVADINAKLPANTVLAADVASTTMTLTSELAGREFKAKFWASDSTTAVVTHTSTGGTVATSFLKSFAGVSMHSYNDRGATIGALEGEYAANAGLRYAKKGEIWVESTEAVTPDDDVWVDLGATYTGQFFTTGGADRTLIPSASWIRANSTATAAAIAF